MVRVKGMRAGLTALIINGTRMEVAGDITYMMTFIKKTPLEGQSGPQGHSGKLEHGWLKCTIRDSSQLNVQEILALDNATVICELANGKSVTARDAYYSGNGEVATSEGELDFQVHSPDVQEVPAS